jgi:hypothetical protein
VTATSALQLSPKIRQPGIPGAAAVDAADVARHPARDRPRSPVQRWTCTVYSVHVDTETSARNLCRSQLSDGRTGAVGRPTATVFAAVGGGRFRNTRGGYRTAAFILFC